MFVEVTDECKIIAPTTARVQVVYRALGMASVGIVIVIVAGKEEGKAGKMRDMVDQTGPRARI